MRSFQFVLISCLIAGTVAAADNPFIGKWTLDAAKSQFTDMMMVEPLGANRYSITFGPGAVDTVVADGTDQPGLRGTTLSVTIEGPNNWKVVRKDKGRIVVTGIWTLSKDGTTLHDAYTANRPDGSTSTTNYVYKRTAGTTGFAGIWESTRDKVSSPLEMQIQAWEGNGLSLSTPGDERDMKFDGKDYPDHGTSVPAGVTSSAVRPSERALQITDKLRGKVTQTEQAEVSSNLRTLTLTAHPVGQSKPNVFVFDRE